ncbi:MFS transporter [Microlunatus sp. Y2014]|uniref:MFS transporter n=1 Tax=Microlunatus sp. Y2014 TaxID=3418488 RepID=UPI003DA70C75
MPPVVESESRVAGRHRELRFPERMAFAVGDFFGGGAGSLLAVLYLFFLTNVIGLNPFLAGLAVMVSKVWDAINDPLVGALSDRTRTRFGRRRPYIVIGGLALIGVYALLWLPDGPAETQAAKAVWASLTYILYNTVQTVIMVPYLSLSTEITTSAALRDKANVLRLLCSTLSSAGCTLVATALFEQFRVGGLSSTQLYAALVLGIGGFFAVAVLVAGIFSRERVPLTPPTPWQPSLFWSPFKVPAFRLLFGLYLCQILTMDMITALLLYYSSYVVPDVNSTVFLGLFIVVHVAAYPIMLRLVRTIDKARIYRTLIPLALVAIIGVAFYPADAPVYGVYALAFVLAVGLAGAVQMPWVMFPDVVDAYEHHHGQRQAGTCGSVITFTRSLATALMIQLVGGVLAITGYVASEQGADVPQPDSAIWGMRLLMAITVLVLMTAGWLLARRYPLDRATAARIRAELDEQRGS